MADFNAIYRLRRMAGFTFRGHVPSTPYRKIVSRSAVTSVRVGYIKNAVLKVAGGNYWSLFGLTVVCSIVTGLNATHVLIIMGQYFC